MTLNLFYNNLGHVCLKNITAHTLGDSDIYSHTLKTNAFITKARSWLNYELKKSKSVLTSG